MKDDCVIIETGQGKVRGFRRNGNFVFYGIPYGAGCGGEHRFRDPRPAESWDGVRDCTQFAPVAIQQEMKKDKPKIPAMFKKPLEELDRVFTGGISFDKEALTYSEDCLNLNIVTPNPDGESRPVIFYIHGGGFDGGNGAVTAAVCDRFCQEEDVVVVSIDHRLGALGYLYLGCFDEAYKSSGLAGMLDIILALEWTRENIRMFGGDGRNITLYGESGGGMKIVTLMAMPKARGLSQKAYINSGACKTGLVSAEEGTRHTKEFLEAAGIGEKEWRKVFQMSVDEILAAQAKVKGNPELTPFYPVADGIHLEWNQDNLYKPLPLADDIPVVVGSSEDELMLMNPVPILTQKEAKKKILENDVLAAYGIQINRDNIDEVFDVFLKKDGIKRNPSHVLAFILSSFHFLGGGAYYFAMEKCRQTAPVYLYKVAYDTPFFGDTLKSAWHTADLPLSFRAVYLPEHERISRDMAHALGAFARTGSPDTPQMEWKPFNEQDKYTLVYGYDENLCIKDPDQDIHMIMDKCCRKPMKGCQETTERF